MDRATGDIAPLWTVRQLGARGLGPDAAAWDALLERMWGGHPLLESAFIDSLLHHFGSGDELLCTAQSPAGQAVAMVILARRGPGLWQTFLPSQAQVGAMVMNDPALVDGLLRALPGHALQIDLLCVDRRYGDLLCWRPTPNAIWHGLTTSVSLTGTFEDYWSARPSQLRKNLRRYGRRADELGDARFVVIVDPNEIPAAVERYAAVESAGWKSKAGTAVAPGSQQMSFYRDLLLRFAASTQSEVHEFWIGDTLAASRLVIIRAGMVVILKKTYDERMAGCSPGNLQLQAMLQDMFTRHAGKVVEFYTNATPEQVSWSTSAWPIHHVSFHRYRGFGELTAAMRSIRTGLRARPPVTVDLTVHRAASVTQLDEDARHMLENEEALHGPAAGPDWYRNLCDTVPPIGDHASFEVLRRDGRAVAVLPIVRRAGRWPRGRTTEALANYYTGLYAPAIDLTVSAAELGVLLRTSVGIDWPSTQLRLGPMDPHSREFTLLRRALEECGLVVFPYFCYGNWYLPRPPSLESYMAGRPGELRSTLQRMGKRLAAAGGRIEIVSDGDRVAAAARAYDAVYAASWKQPEPFPGFMPGLIDLCARRGWLRVGVAWVGDRPIAAQIWIVAHGRAEIFKLAYDADARRFSAGSLLTAALMKHVLEQDGVAEVDYLIGDDPYKKAWMPSRRERWGLVAYRPDSIAGAAGIVRRFGRSLLGHPAPSVTNRA